MKETRPPMTALGDFLRGLGEAPRLPGRFNPWGDVCPVHDLTEDAAVRRLERLRGFLPAAARLLLVGEAPGYQGCRYSGIPFTSERLLCAGDIPRLPAMPRVTNRGTPWSEPSATVVWETLRALGLAETTVLWNAFPFHPHAPGRVLSNRRPTREEIREGLDHLVLLLGAYPEARLVAVGQVAREALRQAGACCEAIRHPAYGGKPEFVAGLRRLACSAMDVEIPVVRN